MHVPSNLLKTGVALACSLAMVSGCGGDDDATQTAAGGTTGGAGTGGAKAGEGHGGTRSGAGSGGTGTGGTGTGGTGDTGSGGKTGGIGGSAEAGSSGSPAGAAGIPPGAAGADGASAVPLGAAEGFVVLAKSGVSTVPTSAITGNVGVSPAAATSVTGFDLTLDATNEFSTSPQVTGKVFAADYETPTPADMTAAVSDMELAFTDAAGRAPDVTELGAGDIGGLTLAPGVYQWGTGLSIPTDVTLQGNATDVWIFQIAQDLTVSSATNVVLSGGAASKNVFWQVSGQVDLGTTAHFEGVVLSQTAIVLGTGASIDGRLLAQTAINLDASTVVEPAP
jgi:hypothetical protein